MEDSDAMGKPRFVTPGIDDGGRRLIGVHTLRGDAVRLMQLPHKEPALTVSTLRKVLTEELAITTTLSA